MTQLPTNNIFFCHRPIWRNHQCRISTLCTCT